MKLTEWYPAKIKPVHVGLYECNIGLEEAHAGRKGMLFYWDGDLWLQQYSKDPCFGQDKPWRGLTEPHHGS